jgi:hypothetical protein
MSKELKIAFPDLEYHFYLEHMTADTASISCQLMGAHTCQWNLRSLNMGIIPATHRAFSAERETGIVTVKGDKVTSWAQQPTKGAGVIAILRQLGIHPPSM